MNAAPFLLRKMSQCVLIQFITSFFRDLQSCDRGQDFLIFLITWKGRRRRQDAETSKYIILFFFKHLSLLAYYDGVLVPHKKIKTI